MCHAPTGRCHNEIRIAFIFRFYRRLIQLVVFFPVGLSSLLHHRHVLLGVKVSSVARLGQLTCQKCRKNDESPRGTNTIN